MQHKLINTGDYLLIVDDSEIKYNDWYYSYLSETIGQAAPNALGNPNLKKVICHLPLNNSSILEGVDLLPPLEDEVEKLADEIVGDSIYYEEDRVNLSDGMDLFMIGYNKAKEKYKYTEDDLIKLLEWVKTDDYRYFSRTGTSQELLGQVIQSLQQPKMPVSFLEKGAVNGTWVGEYIY